MEYSIYFLIHSLIHFYNSSSSPLLLRGAPTKSTVKKESFKTIYAYAMIYVHLFVIFIYILIFMTYIFYIYIVFVIFI